VILGSVFAQAVFGGVVGRSIHAFLIASAQ
jgi:hypothetical protein